MCWGAQAKTDSMFVKDPTISWPVTAYRQDPASAIAKLAAVVVADEYSGVSGGGGVAAADDAEVVNVMSISYEPDPSVMVVDVIVI